MALLAPQTVSAAGSTPTFAAPTVSDTIAADTGLILYVKNGATSSTVTVVVPGNQPYSGAATTDLIQTFSNGERAFFIPVALQDPATGLITVTFSSVATVTVALLKI